MNKISTILFDMDGVLVATPELHKITLNAALEKFGYSITDKEHEDIFNGLPTTVKLNLLSEMKGLPHELHSEIEGLKQDYTLDMIPKTISPNSELINILDILYCKGIRMAICSNARLNSVIKMAKCARIFPYFNIILGNESAKAKPSPDIYLLAMKQLNVNPKECAIVEDSPKGIVAAIGAGPGLLISVKGPEETPIKLKEYFN